VVWRIPEDEAIMTQQEQIERVIGKINAWDHKDILSLREMIAEAKALGTDVRNHMDTLPSEAISVEYKSETFPVWSIDKSGFCITGEQMEILTHVGVIRYIVEQMKKVKI
jgi:hypothetical protein